MPPGSARQEALLTHPREDLAMDFALLVPLADVGQDLGLGEGADALLDEAVLVGEGEVDHGRSGSSWWRGRAAIVPGAYAGRDAHPSRRADRARGRGRGHRSVPRPGGQRTRSARSDRPCRHRQVHRLACGDRRCPSSGVPGAGDTRRRGKGALSDSRDSPICSTRRSTTSRKACPRHSASRSASPCSGCRPSARRRRPWPCHSEP